MTAGLSHQKRWTDFYDYLNERLELPCEVINIENDGGYLLFGIEDSGDTMYGRTCNVTLKWLLPNTAVKEIRV